MEFTPIKTRAIQPPKDDIFEIFDEYIKNIQDWDVIFITSKIISIHQWRCIPKTWIEKKELIKKESDHIVLSDVVPWKDIYLTIKENTLIPSAGIDESNWNGFLILRPNKLEQISEEIYEYLCKKFDVKNIWIVFTDSTTRPLRTWVTWISIYSYWMQVLKDKRKSKDIFWKELEVTQINIVDAISSMAVYLMWEWNESTPILIWRDIPGVIFKKESYKKILIDKEQDLYKPMLDCF